MILIPMGRSPNQRTRRREVEGVMPEDTEELQGMEAGGSLEDDLHPVRRTWCTE
jgi:hypothetical protein